MLTLLAAAGLIVDLTARTLSLCKRHLAQPLLTACLLTATYAVVHVSAEGSLGQGLFTAFWESDAAKVDRHRAAAQDVLQSELRQFISDNKLVDQHLQTVLAKSGASRVRLGVIHNGVTGLTGTGLLRYDNTNSVAGPGRTPGGPLQNQPLADWADFLPALLADQCVLSRVSDMRTIALRAQFEALGAASVLVCPAIDIQGRATGALFVFWDHGDAVPHGEAMTALMALTRQVGGQIATVLSVHADQPCDGRQVKDRS